MGVLTESMTRLRDEILVLRHNRQTFRTELERSTKAAQSRVSALRRALASDLAGAHRAWFGSPSGGRPSTGADRPGRVAGVARGAPGVALQPPPEHHGETRIPSAPAAPAPAAPPPPSPDNALFKKRRKR
jgi:hypothetical protein